MNEALVSPGAVRQEAYGDFVELLVKPLRERGGAARDAGRNEPPRPAR